jgi:hypothetical protein
VFVTPELAVYRYAADRSGETPKKILGDSQGRLVVDQHTGYNAVTKPGKRTRAGCLAHARRKIFEQRQHPETKEALDLISETYLVEREAKEAGIAGTDAHLALRQTRSRPLFARLLRPQTAWSSSAPTLLRSPRVAPPRPRPTLLVFPSSALSLARPTVPPLLCPMPWSPLSSAQPIGSAGTCKKPCKTRRPTARSPVPVSWRAQLQQQATR